MACGAVRKRPSFVEFSPCLSRACLGKMIVFIHKLLKNAVFRRRAQRDLPFEQHATDYCVGAETAGFGAPFYIKTIILPSQARDKHGESTQKQTVFCRTGGSRRVTCQNSPTCFLRCEKRLLLSNVYTKNDHFTKIGSGQTLEKSKKRGAM